MLEGLVILTVLINIGADFMDKKSADRADPQALALWMTILQFFWIVPFIGLVKPIPLFELLICAAVGIFRALGRVPWYSALKRGESLSRLSPFRRLSGVIALILAFVFLGEQFTLDKGVGGFLIVLSAILVSFEEPAKSIKQFFSINKGAFLVLIFALSTATLTVMYKFLLNRGVDFLSLYFFLKMFQVIGLVLFSMHKGTLTRAHQRILNFKVFFIARLMQTIAALIFLFALRDLDLSIAQPLSALTPLFLFILEWVGNRWTAWKKGVEPKTLSRKRVTTFRLVSLGIMLAGLFIMQGGVL